MKVAFVTEDEQTISAHFGRAPKVVVVTVEDGQEVAREVRAKEAHGSGQAGNVELHDHDHEHDHGHHHGDHSSKFAAMQDCDVMVVRGIGSPAIAHAESLGLRVFLTREQEIDAALNLYLSGSLDHDERRIHQH
jgi:predicted Fe-Mo cluster-binding NifX family protein